jgi:hypothetical protein
VPRRHGRRPDGFPQDEREQNQRRDQPALDCRLAIGEQIEHFSFRTVVPD